MKNKLTGIQDINCEDIPYNTPVDFTWWSRDLWGSEVETHLKCKIRHRKTGDIFDFYENGFTRRLTALNWAPEDLEIIK